MANIKLGNNTLTNVNVIKCVDADNPSQTIDFKLGDVVTVQERTITANGTYTAPSGVAYSPVIVDVTTPPPVLQTKSVTYTSNGTRTVTADSGYDGLQSVSVTTTIPYYNGEIS